MLPIALLLYIAILLVLSQINSYLLIGFVFITSILMKAYFPQIKGYIGEKRIHRVLEKLGEDYWIFNDLYVPKQDGQLTQIDHVVVSRYGVFVIETKNYTGWIFGSEKQRNWTQTIYKKKTRFYNPILQNNAHIQALHHYLDVEVPMHSIIVFSDAATLKFKEPFEKAAVIQNSDLRKIIKKFTHHTIPSHQLSYIEQLLQALVPTTRKEKGALKDKHLQQLKENAQTSKKPSSQQWRKTPTKKMKTTEKQMVAVHSKAETHTAEEQEELSKVQADSSNLNEAIVKVEEQNEGAFAESNNDEKPSTNLTEVKMDLNKQSTTTYDDSSINNSVPNSDNLLGPEVRLKQLISQISIDPCPKCGSQLLLRHGKFGAFYGCSAFPKCRYTKKLFTSEK